MPTRKPPAPHPAQPPAEPARRHGVNKPVRPPNHTAAVPTTAARARGNTTRTLAYAETTQRGRLAPTRIKVRAMRQGYYDHIRRHEGDVFYIANEQAFSEKWMERVAVTTPERVTSAPEALRREHDRLLADRMPSSGTPLAHDEPDADSNPLDA